MVVRYDAGDLQMGAICRLHGSVMPKACGIAILPTLVAIGLSIAIAQYEIDFVFMSNSAAYSSFTFVVGFLLVFRTQTSYARFWEGTTLLQVLRGQWVGAFGSLIAYTSVSKEHDSDHSQECLLFRMKLIRMFSCLHACALDHIYGKVDGDTVILGVDGLDDDTLELMNLADDEALVYVIVQWIQQMILHNISNGVITTPAPIVSRVFQDISQGVVTVNNAKKISETPFPFPYCQTLQVVLVIHAIFTPIVFVAWCRDPVSAGLLTFVAVALYWSLNFISAEIEHPFGEDPNDIVREELQEKFNKTLVTMLSPGAAKRPQLRDDNQDLGQLPSLLAAATTYRDAWERMRPKDRRISALPACCVRDSATGSMKSLKGAVTSMKNNLKIVSSLRPSAAPSPKLKSQPSIGSERFQKLLVTSSGSNENANKKDYKDAASQCELITAPPIQLEEARQLEEAAITSSIGLLEGPQETLPLVSTAEQEVVSPLLSLDHDYYVSPVPEDDPVDMDKADLPGLKASAVGKPTTSSTAKSRPPQGRTASSSSTTRRRQPRMTNEGPNFSRSVTDAVGDYRQGNIEICLVDPIHLDVRTDATSSTAPFPSPGRSRVDALEPAHVQAELF
eukprot:TRINITY_DN3660_c0_g1_i3.p1 TRINITY_DN3660_c0_g1~~TRINITY_DN3660_c0_g1_i3.p1  ORF type:complete len:643 (+),score=105.58 TRINITY_DN3660_c0_g1_i3:75-1931(+)